MKVARRDRFLGETAAVTPWSALVAEVKPYYPKGTGQGRPNGIERMLRMYIAQQCFGLSDKGIENAIYDSQAIRTFVGIDLSRESALDATTLLEFRRLLETHQLTERIFHALLAVKGLLFKEGTVVDATIITAPSSTKSQDGQRDPEMHSTKKGNPWHSGMKTHIGVDADSCITHTLVTTPANVHDVTQATKFLHGEENKVWTDSGYRFIEKRPEASDLPVEWKIAMMSGKRKNLDTRNAIGLLLEAVERAKAKIRVKGEHPFHYIKNVFGLKKVRFKGLAKNTTQLFTLFSMDNLLIAHRRLLAFAPKVRPEMTNHQQFAPARGSTPVKRAKYQPDLDQISIGLKNLCSTNPIINSMLICSACP